MEEALAWIDTAVPDRRSAELETVKDRPWSLVAKVPTAEEPMWFKENRAGTRYETRLLPVLARWHPDRVLTPIATEPSRAWSLLPHGGTILREADPAGDADHWAKLLSAHAQFQRDLCVRVPELIGLGVPDVRPERIFEHLGGLEIPNAVTGYLPELKQLCDRLAASPIPASLQHDDLHDGNVFTDGRVFDWGDAVVSHPFGVLLVALRMAKFRLDLTDADPALARLRDAYLEPWTDLGDRASLLSDVTDAVQMTRVSRALAWQRSLTEATVEQRTEFADAVPYWLESLVKPD